MARRTPSDVVRPVPRKVPGVNVARLPLTPSEAFVLAQLEGTRDIEELAAVTNLDDFELARALDRLAALGVVEGTATESRSSVRRVDPRCDDDGPAVVEDRVTHPSRHRVAPARPKGRTVPPRRSVASESAAVKDSGRARPEGLKTEPPARARGRSVTPPRRPTPAAGSPEVSSVPLKRAPIASARPSPRRATTPPMRTSSPPRESPVPPPKSSARERTIPPAEKVTTPPPRRSVQREAPAREPSPARAPSVPPARAPSVPPPPAARAPSVPPPLSARAPSVPPPPPQAARAPSVPPPPPQAARAPSVPPPPPQAAQASFAKRADLAELTEIRRKVIDDAVARMELDDHYQLLGAPRRAPPGELEEAFLRRVAVFDPAGYAAKEVEPYRARMESVLARLKYARDLLCDAPRRREYDDYLASKDATRAHEAPSSRASGVRTPPASMREPAPPTSAGPRSLPKDAAKDPYRVAAERAFAEKDWVSAVNASRVALTLGPEDEALRALHDAASAKAATLLAGSYRSRAAYEEGNENWEAAAKAYQRAAEGMPGDPKPLLKAAECFLLAGTDPRAAVRAARSGVALAPQVAAYRLTLARAYEAAGLIESAVGELGRAQVLAPTDATIAPWLAQLQKQRPRA